MPFEYHGNGATALYSALMAAERGHVAPFEVVNADDWSAGRDQQAFRMIQSGHVVQRVNGYSFTRRTSDIMRWKLPATVTIRTAGSSPERNTLVITKHVFRLVVASVAALACACSEPPPPALPQDVTTAKGRFTVPGHGFVDGHVLEANPALNVWEEVPKPPVCTLAHGDSVELLETKRDDLVGRTYFRVRRGQCEGWLAQSFVSQNKESLPPPHIVH
jgi:hypothetical protein